MEYRDGSRLLYVWMFLGYYTTLHYTYDFQAIHSISNSSLSSSPTNVTFCSVWKKYYDIHVSVGVGMYSTVQYSTALDLLEQLWLHTVHTVHGTSLALNVGDLWSVAAAAAAASARLESSRQHHHIQWRIVLHHWMQCSYTYCSLWMDVYNEITAITWCTCSWFDGLRCGRKLPIVLLLMSYDTIHSYQCHRYRFIARTRCSSYISGE